MTATGYNLTVAPMDSGESSATTTYESASEQRMILKEPMHDNLTSERHVCPWYYGGRGSFRGGFSVCFFIVVLSVCGWVMHRRLSQYDAPQQAIHQSESLKVCVTKRNPITVPSMRGTDAFAVFLLAHAFTPTLNSPGNSQASLAFRVQRERSNQRADVEIRPGLNHFFVLPPPSHLSVL
ncbi:MAG: hypothetical protein WA700_14500 [Acidobacteriaceae bacterium]